MQDGKDDTAEVLLSQVKQKLVGTCPIIDKVCTRQAYRTVFAVDGA